MALVYIVSQAPWGPVKIETAPDIEALLDTATGQPAHIKDLASADPVAVVTIVRQALGPERDGWHQATVTKATQAIKEAVRTVSAMVVAASPDLPAQQAPERRGEAMAITK